ncbi:MAG: hypothetical protein IGR93_10350 [Hydrococcus sp. C42_A2020_068]|uniref:hypothetical protein n=1 Tax=Pleurocapsa sp. PCC 7327 TaxID=118163 RepID=UPI00029F8C1C|nr:hypothetical protein [Pleurocapsa sp. PCC 7327]AFY75741.1 hypothetical protein Ple7327_0274 [Pleurocapsa sp. PCC 7327]MBF2020484.1 hypothetical protein [Hydrococcus sp. C42_A2020_068]
MSIYVGNLFYIPIVVSPSFARFVASELQPQSLTKKDIVKCLKALGIKNPEILSLKWKQELWIQLQFAAVSKI